MLVFKYFWSSFAFFIISSNVLNRYATTAWNDFFLGSWGQVREDMLFPLIILSYLSKAEIAKIIASVTKPTVNMSLPEISKNIKSKSECVNFH